MKTTFAAVLLAALAGVWMWQRSQAEQLRRVVALHAGQPAELATAQQEHRRLEAARPAAAEIAPLQRAAAEAVALRQAPATATPSAAKPLPLGEWTPASQWKNRGDASAHRAIETALWAAAGGDVLAFKNLLSLPPATAEAAEALLAQLPPAQRARYADAAELVTAFTIKNIPVGEAQLVWFNDSGEADATACVFLRNPREKVGAVDFSARSTPQPSPGDRAPPQARDNAQTAETYLSLHRDDAGWRIVVPREAVARIAAELGAAAAR